jgi:preprotein translocase SecE subunit
VRQFLGEVGAEIRKVRWPSREVTVQRSRVAGTFIATVLAVLCLVGLGLYLLIR